MRRDITITITLTILKAPLFIYIDYEHNMTTIIEERLEFVGLGLGSTYHTTACEKVKGDRGSVVSPRLHGTTLIQ